MFWALNIDLVNREDSCDTVIWVNKPIAVDSVFLESPQGNFTSTEISASIVCKTKVVLKVGSKPPQLLWIASFIMPYLPCCPSSVLDQAEHLSLLLPPLCSEPQIPTFL